MLGAVLSIALAGMTNALSPDHKVNSITGSVDCNGYSVTVHADVYGGHELVITVNGTQVLDDVDNGNDTSNRPFGPYTGTDQSVTVVATIYNGKAIESGPVTQSFSNDENCATPTPSASPTPSPTPSATPTPEPSATPTPSATPKPSVPVVTPRPTPPATYTPTDYAQYRNDVNTLVAWAAFGWLVLVVVYLLFSRRTRTK